MGWNKKKGRKVAPQWKSLQLNEAILNSGVEGLVGIEELTDYTILRGKRKQVYGEISDDEIEEDVGKKQKKKSQDKTKSNSEFEQNLLPKSKKRKLSKDIEKDHTLLQTKTVKNVGRKSKASGKVVKPVGIESVTGISNPFLLSETLEGASSGPSSTTIPSQKKTKRKKSARKVPDTQTIETQLEKVSSASTPDRNTNTGSKKRKTTKKSKKLKATVQIPTHKGRSKLKKENKSPAENKHVNDDSSKNLAHQESEEAIAPVPGMEGWSGLNLPTSILRALADKGFNSPTEIQALSLPAAVLGRRDILGAAETGSGKTLAFGIPIIHGILQQKKKEAGLKSNSKDLAKFGESATSHEENDAHDSGDDQSDAGGLNSEDDASGYESETFETKAGGIGCVRVVDNIVGEEFATVATKKKSPPNPLHNQRLYALVLTPTRELAIQVRDHIKAAAKYTGIRVAVVVGGLAAQKQERLLRTSPEIVVATPGRLWELIQEGNDHLQQVDDISFLAIDETDRMIEKGHFQELRELLFRINRDEVKRRKRQNFVFSATLTTVHEPPKRKKRGKDQMRVTPGQKLQDLINMLGITHPKVVDVTQESGTSGTLEEAQITCTFEEKDFYLYYFLIKHPGRTLIFCNSISCVRRLAQLLNLLHCKPLPIHASMVQRQRLRNLDKFRDSPTGLLLATDVAARGLDIPNVQHVIHYQVPRTSEGYIHRSGRTARASKEGLTVLLVEPDEHQVYTRLCRTLGRTQELPTFPISEDLLGAAKQRVKLARDIDQLELKSRRADTEMGWFQKAMTDMEMILDNDDLPMRISEEDTLGNRRAASLKRKQLEHLLSRPLFTSRM